MTADDNKSQGFAAMLAEMDSKSPHSGRRRLPKVGDEVTGKVVVITAESIFLDLGVKAEGVLDRHEVTDSDGAITVQEGDDVTARVVEASEGSIVLKKRMGHGGDAALELEQAQQSGVSVMGSVTGVNKGGVEVEVSGLRCFCPVSQLDLGFVEDPSAFVGQKLEFRVTRFEGGKFPNVVVSRRALLEEERAKQAAEVRKTLEVGSIVPGTVTSLKDYGAFVDLGGLEAMLHISEMGFGRIGHPSEVLKVGQGLQVQITKIEQTGDRKRPERIGLSLKSLADDPWDAVEDKLPKGQKLTGKVVRLEPFGAFVTVAGFEGMVHISQLVADRRVNHPRDVVTVGDEVEVTVLEIDRERRRVALSMKGVEAALEAQQAAGYRAKTGGSSMGTFGDLLKGKLKK